MRIPSSSKPTGTSTVAGRVVRPAVVAVAGDPLGDVRLLEEVRFVMKGA